MLTCGTMHGCKAIARPHRHTLPQPAAGRPGTCVPPLVNGKAPAGAVAVAVRGPDDPVVRGLQLQYTIEACRQQLAASRLRASNWNWGIKTIASSRGPRIGIGTPAGDDSDRPGAVVGARTTSSGKKALRRLLRAAWCGVMGFVGLMGTWSRDVMPAIV